MVNEQGSRIVVSENSKQPGLEALIETGVSSTRALLEHSREIMTLIAMEQEYSAELIGKFKEIAGRLNEPYHIRPQSIFDEATPISDIILREDAIMSFFYEPDASVSKSLESMTSDVLIKVLTEILPSIQTQANEKIPSIPKQTTIQRITNEIKKALGTVETYKPENPVRSK